MNMKKKMDPTEILNVRFHFGGEFFNIGKSMDYVGGDEAMSEIERDKLSLQEVIGFVKDRLEYKDSMKLYFPIPGREMNIGLMYLHDDSGCVKMADYVDPGGVADVFVEYHGEEESEDSESGSDFEDEVWEVSDDEEPDAVITADEPEVVIIPAESAESSGDVFVTDNGGVVTQVLKSPEKQRKGQEKQRKASIARPLAVDVRDDDCMLTQGPISQVENPTQGPTVDPSIGGEVQHMLLTDGTAGDIDSSSDSESDVEYVPHSEDSGEDSEVVELRRHARKIKKRMRASKSWIGSDAKGAVPIDLIANMEEQLEGEKEDLQYDPSDEDYSYSEEEQKT